MKKQFAAIAILVIFCITFFDVIIVFLLSGSVPVLGLTVPPTTMLAAIVASPVMTIALTYRNAVYQYCLELYDEIERRHVKAAEPTGHRKPRLPRRRYQEL